METMKRLLLENNGLASQATINWVETFGDYTEVNADCSRDFELSDSFQHVVLLTQPTLTDIFVSSGLEMPMDIVCGKIFPNLIHERESNVSQQVMQFAYYSYIFFEVNRIRGKYKNPPLNFHINYLGVDFIQDLVDLKWGKDCLMYIKLMLRQEEISIVIYEDYKEVLTLYGETGEDLITSRMIPLRYD
jgi:hypothetical protein